MISFNEALQLTYQHIKALGPEDVELLSAVDRITACDLPGLVNSPSVDVSLKDGYAIHSDDIVAACEGSPVTLQVKGMITAGSDWQGQVHLGEAVRILSGAPIPDGADAVIAEEFTRLDGNFLLVMNDAHPGRNILLQGSDIRAGELQVGKGVQVSALKMGSLAAAGYSTIPVVKMPRVAILATGDEVIAPGEPLISGKLYASNLITLAAWCLHFGFAVKTFIARDDEIVICEKLQTCLDGYDAVLTSGGAWSGERDLVVRILDELGWEKIYHRVRIGPGKAVAFGSYAGKPVFCLPGGPPSNSMAFLQLALPGLQKLSGSQKTGLPVQLMRLAETVEGQSDWTQFIHGRLEETSDLPLFHPIHLSSRFQMMSTADALINIPEGRTKLEKGQIVEGQLLAWIF